MPPIRIQLENPIIVFRMRNNTRLSAKSNKDSKKKKLLLLLLIIFFFFTL